ncbi:hypothetical protein Ddye_020745 [Dipteronia dyeriana]|uniref:DUF659 domain-containing protein n=1 Tax=Dipteronia dyeriana TaxID=168575 RepID=A0AAD9U1D0_9ROSI|nr:hypothetical protein Ddye_020745 [Dipteronia dyeriana]
MPKTPSFCLVSLKKNENPISKRQRQNTTEKRVQLQNPNAKLQNSGVALTCKLQPLQLRLATTSTSSQIAKPKTQNPIANCKTQPVHLRDSVFQLVASSSPHITFDFGLQSFFFTYGLLQFVRWVYEADISFNIIRNNSFNAMLEAVGQYGMGYKEPSRYLLSESLLKEEVCNIKEALKKQEEECKLTGCSIMTDAWIDKKMRSIMNLCVNCCKGTTFLSSKESSNEVHTRELIFNYVDKCIEQVGPQNVVQVVTDNAFNNMAATKRLKEKRPSIFWSSCATHTINLMLESIVKLSRFKQVIDSVKTFMIFIYAHHKTLWMMRSFTKTKDIVRPIVTRFASAFLTLQSLVEKKDNLRAMFASREWDKCKWSKTTKGKTAYSTMMNITFWNGVTTCLKVFAPLVRVLRLVDGDQKPYMGFLYGKLIKAKEEIKLALKGNDNAYRPIIDIIDSKVKDWLDTPLHLMAYLLNPFYLYEDPSIGTDGDIMDTIHTKKRNRLDVDRLNNLVYAQFNANSINKQKRLKNKELNIDVLLASDGDASNAQGWIDEDDDEGVEPDSELSLQIVDETTGADGMTQPQRSARVKKTQKNSRRRI